jgi:NitT/TauT family transport system permease protein
MASVTEAATAVRRIPARPRGTGWSRLPTALRYLILLGVLLAAWQAYATWSEFGSNDLLFASPVETAQALWDGWRDGSLASATWQSLRILLLGVGIGAAIAALFTVLATLTKVGEDALTLLTAIMNPLPGVAMLPLAMLWFGLSTNAVLFTLANATIWPIAINLTSGFKTANPTILAVGRNIGLSPVRLVSDVLAPAALPNAITGLKTAWAFGWRTLIAAELVFGVVGGKGGLGNYINNAKLYLFTPEMFAALVTIAMLGVVFEFAFKLLERRTIVKWGMQRS